MSNQKLSISTDQQSSIIRKLSFVYGSEAEELFIEIVRLLESFLGQQSNTPDQTNNGPSKTSKFSHKNIILNSYPDSIISELPLMDARYAG